MRTLLLWLKTNIILTVSIIICVASIIGLLVIHWRGQDFGAKIIARYAEIKKVNVLRNTQVRVPPDKPDEPPRVLTISVNQAAIDALKNNYAQMNREYLDIYKYAVGVNSQGHLPMLDGLFPEPARSSTKLFEARGKYLEALPQFFKKYSPSSDEPRLDAAPAPSIHERYAAVDRAEAEFRAANLMTATTTLSPEDAAKLKQFKTKKLIEYLVGEAKKIHIYCQTDPTQPEYPFTTMPWAKETTPPDARDVWEAQMQLWVIQDITRALAQTNHVENPESSVINAPIKRLLQIELLPDYVGITGRGGMVANAGGGSTPVTSRSPSGGSAGGGAGNVRPTAPLAANVKLPDDFSLAPTGRRSNDIYDVRHVWLTVIMDSRRMPEFFDRLAQVNFMTVLKMEINDVDEYAAAADGYIYGSGDSVKVRILIETIWLRDWTLKLMPQSVCDMLGITATP